MWSTIKQSENIKAVAIIFKCVELFIELNEISKSVLRLSERFFSKSAFPLSNRYPESVYFKHV